MKRIVINNKGILITVLFLTFTVLFYAPLEMFLQNRGEFWCNLRMIWWIPTLISCVVYIVLSLIGILIKNDKLKGIYSILAFSGGFCAYVQGNFLNMKLGLMDGRKIEWSSLSHAFHINLAIWCAIIAVFLVIGIWKTSIVERVCFYAAGLMIGMQFAALVVLMVPAISEGSFSGKEYKTFSSSEHLWEIGEKDNVIVIVLDSYDQNYMNQLIEEDDDELDKLDGFTYYSNYSGLFRSTAYGIVPLLTGSTYINQKNFWNDLKKNGTFYDDLIRQGYDIDIYTELWHDIPEYSRSNVRNLVEAPIKMDGVRIKAAELLYRLAWSKYLPDVIKCYTWLYGPEFEGFERYESDSETFNWYNSAFRDGLQKNGLTVTKGKKYKFIHLYGAHEPYFTGRELEDVPENWNVEDIPRGGMRAATIYLDEMKRVGVYDDSTIIITSDHGSTHVPGLISNAVLLIKERGAHGSIKDNRAPVSEADFGATIVDLINGNTVYENEVSALQISEDMKRERKYYGYLFTDAHTIASGDGGGYILVEYDVDLNDCSTPLFKLTGNGYYSDGSIYHHEKYCKTCQNGEGPTFENNWMYWEHIETDDLKGALN